MSPGNRAVQMIFDHLKEEEIENRVRLGEAPFPIMVDAWGEGPHLRQRLLESHVDPLVKPLCLEALDAYDAIQASPVPVEHVGGYRNAAVILPPAPTRLRGFWLRLRAWAAKF